MKYLLLITLSLLVLMTGCAPAQTEISLEGTSWRLTSLGDKPVMAASDVTLKFGETGEFTGNAGCNGYFGSYTLDNGEFQVGPVGNTEMACLEPEGLMDQEVDYLRGLYTAVAIEMDGDTLKIVTADGMSMTFSRSQQ